MVRKICNPILKQYYRRLVEMTICDLVLKIVGKKKLAKYKEAIEALNPDYREKLHMIYGGITKADQRDKDSFINPFLQVMEDMTKDKKYSRYVKVYEEIYNDLTRTT